MKTKIAFIAAFCCIAISITGLTETTPTLEIVRRDTTSVYIINYTGSKTGRVKITIRDEEQRTVLIKSYKDIKDFTLPLNFSSVSDGAYSIQIDNGTDKLTKTVNYTKSFAPSYSRVENLGNGLYLLTASHFGREKITINVYNELSTKIFSQEKEVRGDFSMLFNLQNVTGIPYFEISEKLGDFILIPGHPRAILVKENLAGK